MIGSCIAITMSLHLSANACPKRQPPFAPVRYQVTAIVDTSREANNPEDQEWIEAVLAHKASDGNSIKQILSDAEAEKPGIFKVQRAEIDYRYSKDKLRVVIYYWLGRGRNDNNLYTDLTFDVLKSNNGFVVHPFKYDMPKGMEGTNPASSADFGFYSFLGFIDEAYKNDCLREQAC